MTKTQYRMSGLVEDQKAHDLLANIYHRAKVIRNGRFWTTVNCFTDQIEPLSPEVLLRVAWAISRRIPRETSLLLGEEEKGAHITTAVSVLTGIPFVLARYYTYPVEKANPSAVVANLKHEYYAGKLVANGLRAGQTATIIEDTVSTGGTMRAMADICKRAGACVTRVLSAVEKVNYGGREIVRECFGLELGAILRIRVNKHGVEILSTRAWQTSILTDKSKRSVISMRT